MFKRLAPLAIFCASLPAAALAAPVDDSAPLIALQGLDQRVAAIGYRLARANVDICPRTMPLSGLLVHSLDQYAKSARPAAAEAFGLGEEAGLLSVVPESPAARAGLRVGDAIVTIGGRTFPAKAGNKASYARIRAIEDHLLAKLAEGPVKIDYRRGGSARSAILEPETGCLSRVQLVPSGKLNAKADGTYAQVTSGIVEYTRSDDELALVIAHEMAHNILAHRAKLDAQKISRGLLKSFDGSAGKIKATEAEADYLALYLVARAGFDVNAAPGFWKRYGPGGILEIFSDGTHPGKSSRVEAAQRAVAEIAAKRRQGLPLIPAAVAP